MPGMLFEGMEAFDQWRKREVLNRFDLDEKQREFLRLIMECGVRIHMTQEARKDLEFRELVALLSSLHEKGLIPSLEVIEG